MTRDEVLLTIRSHLVLADCLEHARQSGEGDPSHDLSHLLRVTVWTLRLRAPGVDTVSAIAAALLHDVVAIPKDSPLRSQASRMSADYARRLLTGRMADETVSEICDAIEDHSFSRGQTPRSDLGRALQDADRLESLGVLGFYRCVVTGVRMGARLMHDTDPWAMERELDDVAFSVDHWFRKLRLLPSTMQTVAGRAEAERRAETYRSLLRELGDEIGVTAPDDL
jgi:uncharacterized protein